MEVRTSLKDGILQIGAFGPSFDWHHCQLSHITVIIPHHVQPNVQAHVVSGYINVRGSDRTGFKNLKLTTSLGYIKTDKIKVQNELDIQLFTGFLSSQETTSGFSNFQVETGMIDLYKTWSNESNVEVGLGAIKARSVQSEKNIHMTTGIGAICAEMDSKKISTHVDYGFLRVKPADSNYYFKMSSKWGVVDVLSTSKEQARFEEKVGVIEKTGWFGEPHDASEIEMTTTYARAELVFHRSYKLYDDAQE